MPYSEGNKPHIYLPKKSSKRSTMYPTKEGDWVSFINKCHDEALEQRKRHELQWAVNLAYYQGYQNLIYDPNSGILSFLRERFSPLIVNRIGSFIEARHAKLTKNRPIPRVIPNTNDLEDKRAAQYADQAGMHLWRKIDMEQAYDRLLMQMLITGTSFMETMWDPLAGDELNDLKTSEEGDLYLEDDGDGFQEEKVWLGEVSSRPLSSFSILPCDETIPEVKDQPYMIKRAFLPNSKIEMMYEHLEGKMGGSDKSADKTEYEKLVERMGSPLFTTYGGDVKNRTNKGSNLSLVKTMMIAPCNEYERGLALVVINDELQFADVFPNDYGKNIYPWVKFSEKEDGFSFWCKSTIERLIPIQKALNHIKEKKLKNASIMANGKWLLAKGAQVSEEALTDEEGEVIEWNPSVPAPVQAQIAPMPQYVQAFDEELKTDFRDAGGQRETTLNPGDGLTAGIAMAQQAELADEMITPIIRRVGRGMELVAGQQLLLIDEEWIEPRKIKVIGQDGQMGVQWLSAADFKHHTDVHLEIESLMPDFRGAKQQRLFDMWDRRIIQDPQDFLKAYRYGDFDALVKKAEKVEDGIELDINRIKKGKMPEFHPFQNHALYVQRLTEWMNTPEFLRLIPERKQQAIQITQMHLQFLMGSLPGGGEPIAQTNQAAVGTPYGSAKPTGSES